MAKRKKKKLENNKDLSPSEQSVYDHASFLALEAEQLFRAGKVIPSVMLDLNLNKKTVKYYRRICQPFDCAFKNAYQQILGFWYSHLASVALGNRRGNIKAIELYIARIEDQQKKDQERRPAMHVYEIHKGNKNG